MKFGIFASVLFGELIGGHVACLVVLQVQGP